MGWKLKRIDLDGKLEPKPNCELDLKIKLRKEMASAVHGVVYKDDCTPACRAVVKLFKKKKGCGDCDLIPITFTFTDECGQFLFGLEPLPCDYKYVIKIFYFEPEDCAVPEGYGKPEDEQKPEW